MAFNYCRKEALMNDFANKNPIGGPFLNLEIADLRHPWVRASRVARQPNGVAAKRTGRELHGRGFNSSYDHIKDTL